MSGAKRASPHEVRPEEISWSHPGWVHQDGDSGRKKKYMLGRGNSMGQGRSWRKSRNCRQSGLLELERTREEVGDEVQN